MPLLTGLDCTKDIFYLWLNSVTRVNADPQDNFLKLVVRRPRSNYDRSVRFIAEWLEESRAMPPGLSWHRPQWVSRQPHYADILVLETLRPAHPAWLTPNRFASLTGTDKRYRRFGTGTTDKQFSNRHEQRSSHRATVT